MLAVLVVTVGLELVGAAAAGSGLPPQARLFTAMVSWGIAIIAITRLGLLAMTVASGVYDGLVSAVLTSDLSAWYATGTIVAVGWALLLAGYGAWTALAGRPMFASAWLDE